MKIFIIWLLSAFTVLAGEEYKFDPEAQCRTYLILKYGEESADWIMGYPKLPDTIELRAKVDISGTTPKLHFGASTTWKWVSPDGQTACLYRFDDSGAVHGFFLYDKREGRAPVDPKPVERIVKEDSAKAKKK
jgi:hypothetical protein